MSQNPPNIHALPQDISRPLISVMIPTYEPDRYLLETLVSILEQDPGQDKMQIAVVDDASPQVDVIALINSAGLADRVDVIRNKTNLGLARNWNECIRQARGELVHILHQDDLVSAGFYSSLCEAFAKDSSVGMAFCRCAFINSEGIVVENARAESSAPGILQNWLPRITKRYSVHCPAAIVRRSTYELLGGFRDDLRYALDWEMWVRIAARFPVAYDPKILACHRRHSGSETSRLNGLQKTHMDELAAMSIFSAHIPEKCRDQLMTSAYCRLSRSWMRRGRKLTRKGEITDAQHQLECAQLAIDRIPHQVIRKFYSLRLLLLKLRTQ